MSAWRKFKLEGAEAMARFEGVNDNIGTRNDLETVRGLTKLIIDIAGIVQGECLSANYARHADIILEIRHLLGQIFDVAVIEITMPKLKLDISEQIKRFDSINWAM